MLTGVSELLIKESNVKVLHWNLGYQLLKIIQSVIFTLKILFLVSLTSVPETPVNITF